MLVRLLLWMTCAAGFTSGLGAATPAETAAAFGAREDVEHASLSPGGTRLAFIAPSAGQGSVLYVLDLDGKDPQPHRVTSASGKPERLGRCDWVSDRRLACQVYGVVEGETLLPFTRLVAIDADGGNAKVLSTRSNFYTRGLQLGGGQVIDWLPDEDGRVLMTRVHLPDDHTGSHIGSTKEGVGVDRIDTASLAASVVEQAKGNAVEYISDGRGTVRIMGMADVASTGMSTGRIDYFYRRKGERSWQRLGTYDGVSNSGFDPYAVDAELDVAYGFMKTGGRQALYRAALDGSGKMELVFARPDVDVDGLLRIGRRRRVVGASFATDRRESFYFDPAIQKVAASLHRSLPKQPSVRVVDASVDEGRLLVFASSDTDPGTYYVLDRATNRMRPVLAARERLEGMALGTMRPIRYPAADGTSVPGYLTLPAGREDAKGLPAIVLPHGGPSARDEWGFDWLVQFFAARGYAVLQPNFRGSAGYGDAWFAENGFRSWKTAVGDVTDAGRWLVAQGIADPARLAIFGWSYGGYAALQSAVTAPGLFKAVVAVAPVTDLDRLREERRNWTNYRLVANFIGTGPHLVEGSPTRNAGRISVPVLLFHGTVDRNVGYDQSTLMADRLRSAGKTVELVTFKGLDHQLDDGEARARMLERADAFIRAAGGAGIATAK